MEDGIQIVAAPVDAVSDVVDQRVDEEIILGFVHKGPHRCRAAGSSSSEAGQWPSTPRARFPLDRPRLAFHFCESATRARRQSGGARSGFQDFPDGGRAASPPIGAHFPHLSCRTLKRGGMRPNAGTKKARLGKSKASQRLATNAAHAELARPGRKESATVARRAAGH